MKDWQGKSYDYTILRLGNFIVPQKWINYEKWTDFPEGKWITQEMMKAIEYYENPKYKFFWWWLRFANFVRKILGVLKLKGDIKFFIPYFLQVLAKLEQTGSCLFRVIYKLQLLNSLKVLGQGLAQLKFWIISTGIFKALGQGLVIIRISLQILGIEKILGICNVIIRILLQISGDVKIQGASCATQYVSWQHFGTWQEWSNTTGGKWLYIC
jgi:hypothetical protein